MSRHLTESGWRFYRCFYLLLLVGLSLVAGCPAARINGASLMAVQGGVAKLLGENFETPGAECETLQSQSLVMPKAMDCQADQGCYLVGLESLSKGQWLVAAQQLQYSTTGLAAYYRGWALWCSGSLEAAFRSWRISEPFTVDRLLKQGAHWMSVDAPQSAVAWFELANAVSSRPSAKVLTQIGDARRLSGKLVEAGQAYRAALETGAAEAAAYGGLAIVEVSLGMPDEARRHIQTALQLDQANWSFQQIYGGLLLTAGDWKEAEGVFRTVIKLKPDYSDAYAALSETLILQDRLSEARQQILEAVSREPADPKKQGYLLAYSQAALRSGQFSEMEFSLKLAYALDPQNAEVVALLVQAYAALGQCYDAQNWLTRLAVLSPSTVVSVSGVCAAQRNP